MLQSIGDHISMMDKDLNIIWANETAKILFGNDIGIKLKFIFVIILMLTFRMAFARVV